MKLPQAGRQALDFGSQEALNQHSRRIWIRQSSGLGGILVNCKCMQERIIVTWERKDNGMLECKMSSRPDNKIESEFVHQRRHVTKAVKCR